MDRKPQDKKHRPWSWKQFSIALCLIPLGIISFLVGVSEGKSVGGTPITAFLALGGLCIAFGGITWIIVLIIRLIVLRLIVLRRRSRRS